MLYLVASSLTEFWKRNLFYDVIIYCGIDGGIVKSHRLVLAGLSPVFQSVLKMAEQDPATASTDETIIILPDVSSKVLLLFLEEGM